MSLGTILLILLVLVLIGALPTWGYSGSLGIRPFRDFRCHSYSSPLCSFSSVKFEQHSGRRRSSRQRS